MIWKNGHVLCIWKDCEEVVTYFKPLCRNLAGGTEENHEHPQPRQSMCRHNRTTPEYKSQVSQLRRTARKSDVL